MFNLINIVSNINAAVITITIHEFTKALISSFLGDPLPKRDKRVSINPLVHVEPIGFIIMMGMGFGWGRPVETASIYYKDRKAGTLVTYIVPSLINLLVGILVTLIIVITKPSSQLYIVLYCIAIFNLRHAFFNIIPVYPLDGAKVLSVLRNPNNIIATVNNQMFYQVILLILIAAGFVGRVINPVCLTIMNFIFSIYA